MLYNNLLCIPYWKDSVFEASFVHIMMLCSMNGIFLLCWRPSWIFGHKKNSRREFSRNFLYVVWDDILLQMSHFPALCKFCLGSLLILPAYEWYTQWNLVHCDRIRSTTTTTTTRFFVRQQLSYSSQCVSTALNYINIK